MTVWGSQYNFCHAAQFSISQYSSSHPHNTHISPCSDSWHVTVLYKLSYYYDYDYYYSADFPGSGTKVHWVQLVVLAWAQLMLPPPSQLTQTLQLSTVKTKKLKLQHFCYILATSKVTYRSCNRCRPTFHNICSINSSNTEHAIINKWIELGTGKSIWSVNTAPLVPKSFMRTNSYPPDVRHVKSLSGTDPLL